MPAGAGPATSAGAATLATMSPERILIIVILAAIAIIVGVVALDSCGDELDERDADAAVVRGLS